MILETYLNENIEYNIYETNNFINETNILLENKFVDAIKTGIDKFIKFIKMIKDKIIGFINKIRQSIKFVKNRKVEFYKVDPHTLDFGNMDIFNKIKNKRIGDIKILLKADKQFKMLETEIDAKPCKTIAQYIETNLKYNKVVSNVSMRTSKFLNFILNGDLSDPEYTLFFTKVLSNTKEEDIKPIEYNKILKSILQYLIVDVETDYEFDENSDNKFYKAIKNHIKIKEHKDVSHVEMIFFKNKFAERDNFNPILNELKKTVEELKSIDENKLKKVLNDLNSGKMNLEFGDEKETPENIIKKIIKIIQTRIININNYIKAINELIKLKFHIDKINSSVFIVE